MALSTTYRETQRETEQIESLLDDKIRTTRFSEDFKDTNNKNIDLESETETELEKECGAKNSPEFIKKPVVHKQHEEEKKLDNKHSQIPKPLEHQEIEQTQESKELSHNPAYEEFEESEEQELPLEIQNKIDKLKTHPQFKEIYEKAHEKDDNITCHICLSSEGTPDCPIVI